MPRHGGREHDAALFIERHPGPAVRRPRVFHASSASIVTEFAGRGIVWKVHGAFPAGCHRRGYRRRAGQSSRDAAEDDQIFVDDPGVVAETDRFSRASEALTQVDAAVIANESTSFPVRAWTPSSSASREQDA